MTAAPAFAFGAKHCAILMVVWRRIKPSEGSLSQPVKITQRCTAPVYLQYRGGPELPLHLDEAAAIIEEVNISARIASTNWVQENCPSICAALNLNVWVLSAVAVVSAKNDSNPLRLVNYDRDVWRTKIRTSRRLRCGIPAATVRHCRAGCRHCGTARREHAVARRVCKICWHRQLHFLHFSASLSARRG